MSNPVVLQTDEHVILKTRKHWAILVYDVSSTIALGFVPFAIWTINAELGSIPSFAIAYATPIAFAATAWLLIVWTALAVLWTDYYLDLWIVTNRRIFNIEQIGLFNRRVSTWGMENIQEISTNIKNPLEAFLGYGSIEIETAGPSGVHAKMDGISNPERVRTIILRQIGRVEKLEATTKKQEGLLHMIGHEVKGYLTKNAAALASITEGDYGSVSAPLKTMADSALQETRKGVSTVMNILDSSDPHEGSVRLEKSRFDIRESANQVVESLKPDAERKGLALELIASDGTFEVAGDEMKLRELVFRNLIDNAIRYTPYGSIRVMVTRSSSHVIFSVKDTGIGITHETMQKLFTEGGKGADSKAVNAESTGYGLFIAKSIVDAHGGRMWVESEGQGKGSQFFVELPAAA